MADVPIQLTICCGDLMSDHGDQAAGEFRVQRGSDALVSLAREGAHDGTERQSEYCNCLTFLMPDGTVRRQWSDRTARYLVPPDDSPGTLYAVADLTDTYRHPQTGNVVSSYHRAFLWLKPDVLVVYDRVAKLDPAVRAVFHLNAPKDQANAAEWAVGGSGLDWTTVSPQVPTQRVPLMLGTPAPNTTTKTLSSYDMQVIEPGGQATAEFLNVLQFGPKGFTPRPVTQAGDLLRIGELVLWRLPGQPPALVGG